MYPLVYVFRHPKNRISGVPDYLAVHGNSLDLASCQALGSCDGFHLPHASPQHALEQRFTKPSPTPLTY